MATGMPIRVEWGSIGRKDGQSATSVGFNLVFKE